MRYDFLFGDISHVKSLKYISTQIDFIDINSIFNNTNNFKVNPLVEARAVRKLHNYWTLYRLSNESASILIDADNSNVDSISSISINQEVDDEFEFYYNR